MFSFVHYCAARRKMWRFSLGLLFAVTCLHSYSTNAQSHQFQPAGLPQQSPPSQQQQPHGLCQNGFYQCASGLCIPSLYLCDGMFDCGPLDVSDENNCGETTCPYLSEINRCADAFPKSLQSGVHDWGHLNFTSLFRMDGWQALADSCLPHANYSNCVKPYLKALQCPRYVPINSVVRSLFGYVCAEPAKHQLAGAIGCLNSLHNEPQLGACSQTTEHALAASAEPGEIANGSPYCRVAKEIGNFVNCVSPLVRKKCGVQTNTLLHGIADRISNDTNIECHSAPLILGSLDCKETDQLRLAECQGMLDHLTGSLEFFHFSNPLAPTDNLKNFTSTCVSYDKYHSCMESVRHCYDRDSNYFFMKATIGIICDAEIAKSVQQEISSGGTCTHALQTNAAMQNCLGNYSDIYDPTVNEITSTENSQASFCRVLNALRNLASCAEPVIEAQCGPQATHMTQAISDYAFGTGVHDGCIVFEGGSSNNNAPPVPGGAGAFQTQPLPSVALLPNQVPSPGPFGVHEPSSPNAEDNFFASTTDRPVGGHSIRGNASVSSAFTSTLPSIAASSASAISSASPFAVSAEPSLGANAVQSSSSAIAPPPAFQSDCSPLKNNLLRACYAPFSGIALENVTAIDFETVAVEQRRVMLSQMCTSHLLFDECYRAVLASDDCVPLGGIANGNSSSSSGGIPQQFKNTKGGISRAEIEAKVGAICRSRAVPSAEKACFDQLNGTKSGADGCDREHIRQFFVDFGHVNPDFVFGGPATCQLSEALQLLTQCLTAVANRACSTSPIVATLRSHQSLYSQTFSRCSSAAANNSAIISTVSAKTTARPTAIADSLDSTTARISTEDRNRQVGSSEGSSNVGDSCSQSKEQEILLCLSAFEPFQNITPTTLSQFSKQDKTFKLIEGCSVFYLFEQCANAARGNARCRSENSLLEQTETTFLRSCNVTLRELQAKPSCFAVLSEDSSAQGCSDSLKSKFEAAAEKGFQAKSFDACGLIRQLEDAVKCVKPRMLSLCDDSSSQFVDKFLQALHTSNNCFNFNGSNGFNVSPSAASAIAAAKSTSATPANGVATTANQPALAPSVAGDTCDNSEVVVCMAGFTDLRDKFKAEGGAALIKIPLNEDDFNETCAAIADYNDCAASVESDLRCVVRSPLHPFVHNFESILCNPTFRSLSLEHRQCLTDVTTDPQFKQCSDDITSALSKNFEHLIQNRARFLCEIFQAMQNFSDCTQPISSRVCSGAEESGVESLRAQMDATLRANAKQANCSLSSAYVRIVPGIPTIQAEGFSVAPENAFASVNVGITKLSSAPAVTSTKRPKQKTHSTAEPQQNSGLITVGTPIEIIEPELAAQQEPAEFGKQIIELRLPDEEWNEALKDKDSGAHKALSKKINNLLTKALKPRLPGFKSVEIMDFSKGSVRVRAKITAAGTNATEIQNIIRSHIGEQNGRLGEFNIDSTSISVVDELANSFTYVGECTASMKNKTSKCVQPFESFTDDLLAVFQGGLSHLQQNVQTLTNKTCGTYDNQYLGCIKSISNSKKCTAYSCLMRAVSAGCKQRDVLLKHWQCVVGLFKNKQVIKCFLDLAAAQEENNDDGDDENDEDHDSKGPLSVLTDATKLKAILPSLINCVQPTVTQTCGAETFDLLHTLGTFTTKQAADPDCKVMQDVPSAIQQDNRTTNKTSPWTKPEAAQPEPKSEPEPTASTNRTIQQWKSATNASHAGHAEPEPTGQSTKQRNATKPTAEPKPGQSHDHHGANASSGAIPEPKPEPEGKPHPAGANTTSVSARLKTTPLPKKPQNGSPDSLPQTGAGGSTLLQSGNGWSQPIVLTVCLLFFLFFFVPGYAEFASLLLCFTGLVLLPTLLGHVVDYCAGRLGIGPCGQYKAAPT